jgi:ferritin-like protein
MIGCGAGCCAGARRAYSFGSMSEYHEPESELSAHGRDLHRALTSLKEEIEAIDWYNQRWEASRDESLRSVLAHNRDEEMEHAVMTLEWLRRNMPPWDHVLRTYLFTKDPISAIEERVEGTGADTAAHDRANPPPAGGDLGIGSQRRPK